MWTYPKNTRRAGIIPFLQISRLYRVGYYQLCKKDPVQRNLLIEFPHTPFTVHPNYMGPSSRSLQLSFAKKHKPGDVHRNVTTLHDSVFLTIIRRFYEQENVSLFVTERMRR
jgi:hypothetical protein